MTKDEILQKYLALHDALGTRKDAEDKELFDQQHRQVWHDCDVELLVRKAELEAKSTLTTKEETELTELKSIFFTPPPPPRNWAKEVDEIKASLDTLIQKVDTIATKGVTPSG